MKVLGFSQDFTTCDRCGKTELKGTWAIETSNGEIYRLGTSCIHKKLQMEPSEGKALINGFKKEQKELDLFNKFIQPLKDQLADRLKNTFTTTYANLPDHARSVYHKIEDQYQRSIDYRLEKFKLIRLASQARVITLKPNE